MAFSTGQKPDPPRTRRERRRTRAAAVLAAAGLAVLAGGPNAGCGRRADLGDVLEEARWTKPRLSGDGPSTLCPPATGRAFLTSCPPRVPPPELVKELFVATRAAPRERRFAVAALLRNGPAEALDTGGAESVAERVDAAALELVLGAKLAEPERYGKALVLTGEALAEDPGDPRALFNHALASEQLYLDELAGATWRRYLEVETEELWRREARRHLERLARPSVVERWRGAEAIAGVDGDDGARALCGSFAAEVREHFLRRELERWAGGDGPPPCRELDTWSRLGRACREATSDALLHQSVAWLGETFCREPPGDPGPARAALRELGRGLERHDRLESAASFEILERAAPALRNLASPLHLVAELSAAIDLFGLSRYAEAADRFAAVEAEARAREMTFVEARAAWMRGTIALREQDPAGALEHYRRARRGFDRGRDLPHRAGVRGLIAETLGRMGSGRAAWRAAWEGLRIAREHGLPRRLYAVCSLAGTLARMEGNDALAEPFQSCAIDFVGRLGAPAMAYDAHMWRAVTRHRRGRLDAALEDLEAARRNAGEIADRRERERARADVALVEGALLAGTEPGRARRLLAQAIDFFDASGHHYYASDARRLRASIDLRAGRLDAAEADLHRVLVLHERFRTADDDVESRLEVLAGDRSVYSRLVELELVHRGDPWRALYFADRGKQDRYRAPEAGAPAWHPGEIEATLGRWRKALSRLPETAAVVCYHLLGDELVTWVLQASPDGPAMATSRRAGAPEGGPVDAWAAALAGSLGGPVDPGGVVVFVPDGALNGFPFAALPLRGRPLVETAAVAVATSLDDFLAPAPPGRGPESLDRLTAFLAPEAPAARRAGLPRLPLSERELEVLNAAFAEPEIAAGARATAGRFLDRLAAAGVLHVSSHALVDGRRPLASALLLAPGEERGDGRVSALDLYAAPAPAASLVTLAACGTAAAPRALPASLTLVRPFLAAGVPAVVGSLAALPDDVFVAFLQTFYSELAGGATVVDAVRSAQLDLLAASAPGDTSWAQIELFATHRALDLRRTDAGDPEP